MELILKMLKKCCYRRRGYATIYDEVLDRVSNRRILLGSFQSRLNYSLELADISQRISQLHSRGLLMLIMLKNQQIKAKMLINTVNSLLMQNQVDMGRAYSLSQVVNFIQ